MSIRVYEYICKEKYQVIRHGQTHVLTDFSLIGRCRSCPCSAQACNDIIFRFHTETIHNTHFSSCKVLVVKVKLTPQLFNVFFAP